jgi:hypothetical protein
MCVSINPRAVVHHGGLVICHQEIIYYLHHLYLFLHHLSIHVPGHFLT